MKLSFDLRSIFSRIWETIVENIGLKVLSFAFALGLYAFIHGAQDAQKSISVDVVATTPPESAHRVLVTPLPDHVRVTIRGPRTIVDDVKPDELGSFQLDLRSGKVDRIEFDPAAIHVPPGVRAEQVDPPSISLRWEDEVIREIPVHSAITGQPAPGFVVKGAPKVEPATVRALGPRSVVDVVQFAPSRSFRRYRHRQGRKLRPQPSARSTPRTRASTRLPPSTCASRSDTKSFAVTSPKSRFRSSGFRVAWWSRQRSRSASRDRPDVVRSLDRRSSRSHHRSAFCRSEHLATGLGQAPGHGGARRLPRDGAAANRGRSLVGPS